MTAYEMAATVDFGLDAKQGLLDLRSEAARLALAAKLFRAALKRLDFVERAQARARSNGRVRFPAYDPGTGPSMGRWHGRSWIPAAAAAAIALAAAPASGGPSSRAAADLSLTGPGGRSLHGSWQRWARASLMPTVGGRITLKLSGCPALPRAAGCVYRKRPRTIYLRSGLRRPRSVLMHELGHLYDLRVLNNRDRGRFRRIMRARKRAWWKGEDPARRAVRRGVLVLRALPEDRLDLALLDLRVPPQSAASTRRSAALILAAADDRKPAAPAPQAPVVTRPDPAAAAAAAAQHRAGLGRQAAAEADPHAGAAPDGRRRYRRSRRSSRRCPTSASRA